MVILELRIDHFGKLKNRQISFRPGTNIITGNNETGKSTIAAFIKAMLYGLREGEEEYQHFFPRAYEGTFGGSLKLLEKNLFYEIRREFSGDHKFVRVRELSNGLDVEDPEAFLKKLLGGLSREDFEESGFIRTESFAGDAERYRETEEKNREAKREEEIRNHFFNARSILLKTRDAYRAETDDTLQARRYHLTERETANAAARARIDKRLPEATAEKDNETASLEKDGAAVDASNAAREQGFRGTMLDAKAALADYLKSYNRSVTRSNVFGILCLVLGILGGVAVWFYRMSYEIGFLATGHERYWPAFAATLGAAALFVLGIVLTVIAIHKRRVADARLWEQEDLNDNVASSEWAYQDYLDHRAEIDDRIPDEEERRAHVEALSAEIAALEKERIAAEEEREQNEADDRALSELEDNDRAVRKEIRALDLAIATFDRVGHLNENPDYDEFSELATEFYRGLLPEKPAKIRVKYETVTLEMKDSGRHLLLQLSTGTMHETLIAVRMAKLQTLDPAKKLPFILDDVFTNFDEERLAAAMEYLRSTGRQVILFSCKQDVAG